VDEELLAGGAGGGETPPPRPPRRDAPEEPDDGGLPPPEGWTRAGGAEVVPPPRPTGVATRRDPEDGALDAGADAAGREIVPGPLSRPATERLLDRLDPVEPFEMVEPLETAAPLELVEGGRDVGEALRLSVSDREYPTMVRGNGGAVTTLAGAARRVPADTWPRLVGVEATVAAALPRAVVPRTVVPAVVARRTGVAVCEAADGVARGEPSRAAPGVVRGVVADAPRAADPDAAGRPAPARETAARPAALGERSGAADARSAPSCGAVCCCANSDHTRGTAVRDETACCETMTLWRKAGLGSTVQP
jgi:hypothetical protein